MRFFLMYPDELIVSDGKTCVLVMVRGGEHHRMADPRHIEIEGPVGDRPMCEGCSEKGLTFDMCDPCKREVIPR